MSSSHWTDRTGCLVPALLGALLTGCGMVGGGAAPAPVDTGAGTVVVLPPAAEQRWRQAVAARKGGDTRAAREGFRQLTSDFPELAGPLVNLAILAAEEGDTDTARRLLERALTVCSACAPVWNELGVLERRAGQFAAAEQAYLTAIEADPAYPLPYFNLGVLHDLYWQRPAQAANWYERYLERGPDLDSDQEVRAWVSDLRRRAELLSGAGNWERR